MVAPIDEKLSENKLEMIWLYQKRTINVPMKNSKLIQGFFFFDKKLIQVNGTKKDREK